MSKYDIVTGHREWDNVCVVRIDGVYGDVFWREIPLVQKWWHIRSPRTKIINAQIAAEKKADKLRRRDAVAQFEYRSAVRNGEDQ